MSLVEILDLDDAAELLERSTLIERNINGANVLALEGEPHKTLVVTGEKVIIISNGGYP